MKKTILFALAIVFASIGFSQGVTKLEGDYAKLNGVKNIKLEFVYDQDMRVGKTTEKQYIEEKKAKYEVKHPGEGDKWVEMWESDRTTHYQPKFAQLFNKILSENGITADENLTNFDATLVIHTYFIEPGFNVGIMKTPALVSYFAIFKDKDGNEILKLNSLNAPGQTFGDGDFDSGIRVGESYAKGAKTLASHLIKKKAF